MYGAIDNHGTVIAKPEYDIMESFNSAGIALVRKNGKWGYINQAYEAVVPAEYEKVNDFDVNNLACIEKNHKAGYINKQGKIIIPIEYDYIGRFIEGIARARNGNKWGYVDTNGNVVVPFKYDDIKLFDQGLAYVRIREKVGYIDHENNVILPIQFDAITPPDKKHVIRVINKGKVRAYNDEGQLITEDYFDSMSNFNSNFSLVSKDGKWGMIDIKGNSITPITYDSLHKIEGSENLVLASRNGMQGILHSDGSWLVPVIYDKVEKVQNKQLFILHRQHQFGLATTKDITIPVKYDELLTSSDNSLVYAKKNSQYGYLSENGKEVIPIIYQELDETLLANPPYNNSNNYVRARLKGKWGYLDEKGKLVTPIIYDYAYPYEGDGYGKVRQGDKIKILTLWINQID